MEIKQSTRIQTSLLNGVEKKALVWLAERQPAWVTSDHLTFIGFLGAVIIAIGYVLTTKNINWLWLSNFGFLVNWYGDSLDGTLARVRKTQRPIYGFYVDHTVDAINECIMFIGAGYSALLNLPVAMIALILYLLLSMNVNVNAHLKGEFKLTYAKLGPTEFRILMVIVNCLFLFVEPVRNFRVDREILGNPVSFGILDLVGIFIITAISIIYLVTIYTDAKAYAKIDPPKKKQ
ncbi:MAG: CDP-alcohol phosphatidyltransferase family protein [Candidatus Cryptobacteroides sp.]